MADHHGHAAAAAHDDHHEEHIHTVRHYVNVYFVLVGLFIVSVLGPMLGIKIVTLITAFGVAVVKASLVVHYFMHLTVEKRFVHYFMATSLAFMFLFFFAVAPDVMKHEGTNWVNVAAKAETAKIEADPNHGAPAHHEGGGEHGGAAEQHGGGEHH
jgi:caa(3)-type oxidase subunit IV